MAKKAAVPRKSVKKQPVKDAKKAPRKKGKK